MRRWTVLELAYIAKFVKYDGVTSVAYAMDAKPSTILAIVNEIYNRGEIQKYREIWDQIHKRGEWNGYAQSVRVRTRRRRL
jgi:hypothetical protein